MRSYHLTFIKSIVIGNLYIYFLAYIVWGLLLSLQPPFYPSEAEKKGATPSQVSANFNFSSNYNCTNYNYNDNNKIVIMIILQIIIKNKDIHFDDYSKPSS